jgi:DNA polymerase III subunit delta'
MKYNWSIIGHKKQLEWIERDISSDNLSHAYLLVGPNSVGKHTVAKKMAGILQCGNDFCHQCPTCLQVIKGSHVDTIEMKDNKESLKIEEIRALIERLSMTRQSKYKIVLIQSLERMTTEAANSFLKILEEPPKKTIFIMTSNDVRALLPTIISRVRVFQFHRVSAKYLNEKLNELYPDVEESLIKEVSLFSLGRTGKALQLMENPDVLSDYIKIYNDIQNFLDHKNIVDRFLYVEDLLSEAVKIEVFLNLLKNVLRSKILERDSGFEKYLQTIDKIEETLELLAKNVNARLALENLMLKI